MALPLTGLPNFQLWLVAPSLVSSDTAIQLLDDTGSPVTDMLDEPVLIPVDHDGGFSFETGFGDYEIELTARAPVVPPDEFPLAVSIDSDVVDLGAFAISLAAAGDPDELVRTGVDPFWPFVGAGVVAALGVLLLLKRRRTKDDSASDGDVTD